MFVGICDICIKSCAMEELIPKVFNAYCEEYERILKVFTPYPDPKRHSLHEVNQVAKFQKIYELTCGSENVITWLELGIKGIDQENNRTSRIDGFIADMDRQIIIFIEAKRLSRDKNIDGLYDDLNRAQKIKASDIKGPEFNANFFSGFSAYCVLLADFCTDHHQLSPENKPKIIGDKGKVEYSENMKKICLNEPTEINENYYLMYALHKIEGF